MNAVDSVQQVNRDILLQKHLEDAIEEHRRAGSPVRVIDTPDDLTREEKAVLYDKVCMRVKGRPGKSNPYKTMEVICHVPRDTHEGTEIPPLPEPGRGRGSAKPADAEDDAAGL